jgi:hypothetical protein
MNTWQCPRCNLRLTGITGAGQLVCGCSPGGVMMRTNETVLRFYRCGDFSIRIVAWTYAS